MAFPLVPFILGLSDGSLSSDTDLKKKSQIQWLSPAQSINEWVARSRGVAG